MPLCQILKCFCLLRLSFKFSKSWKFARKISVAEFRYSQTTFFVVHNSFTDDSEAHGFMKLNFETLPEILASSQFKI